MGLNDAVKAFEADFAKVVSPLDGIDPDNWARCTAGASFQTVVSYGLKPLGKALERTYDTPLEAIAAWLATARMLTEQTRGTLYWRHAAEVEKTSDGKWTVYSRFAATEA